MVPPASPAFIRLGDGKVLGAAMPATPDDGFRDPALPPRTPADLRPAPIVVQPDKSTPDRSTTGGAATGAEATARGRSGTGSGTTHPQGSTR
jgi:hypothetical protein